MAVNLFFIFVFLCILGDVSCKITPKSNTKARNHAKFFRYTEPQRDISIPIMLHMDTATTHQMAKLKGYQKTKEGRRRLNFAPKLILREVEKVLKSLDQRVHLKLVNFKIVTNQTLDVDENVSDYLRNYCAWQKNMKVKRGETYFSVLLTGLDVYYIGKNGKKVRESTGRGYMGRMCSMHRSCAVVKWHEKDLVYLLAHEIAHSLGVYHDGTKNSCRAGFIMATQYSRENVPQHWSTCSKTHLEEFLRNKEKSWCVNKKFKKVARRRRN
ncbi:A disintegrin and metalloproteinase with thrombospondin motifs 7-like [Cydia pomonella]|uniref:A disintegrin and metalloproteinase with thrombospondin motifs 7-like n=1 Tax=Cydia pomonella TaxID=82600 RepID=UPI002ADD9F65|nr:A disintegrin and metalloproteinase with thrombospondin motifs 7-like [Cydia pomonella]